MRVEVERVQGASGIVRFGVEAALKIEDIYRLFPRLKQRAGNIGGQLFGGEQQMLAIGRTLVTNPHLLILDEATEGLAPFVRAEIWHCLTHLKQRGQTLVGGRKIYS